MRAGRFLWPHPLKHDPLLGVVADHPFKHGHDLTQSSGEIGFDIRGLGYIDGGQQPDAVSLPGDVAEERNQGGAGIATDPHRA